MREARTITKLYERTNRPRPLGGTLARDAHFGRPCPVRAPMNRGWPEEERVGQTRNRARSYGADELSTIRHFSLTGACDLANAGADLDSLIPCESQNAIGAPNPAKSLTADQTIRCGDCSSRTYGNAYNASTDTENTRIVRRSRPESVKAAKGSSQATYHGYSEDA